MTFFTAATPDSVRPAFGLSQQGRAGLEILGSVQKFASRALREAARATYNAGPEAPALADAQKQASTAKAMRQLVADTTNVVVRDPIWRLERFLQRYVGEEIFARGIIAIEERRAAFEAFLAPPVGETLGNLELNPAVTLPKYYANTDWHLEPGGWDGYDLYGAVFAFGIGPLVFRHGGYAAVGVGDDIVAQRSAAVRQLPKQHYGRIFEPGCGGASTMSALHKAFPAAELVGCDLSTLLLTMGHSFAERQGIPVTFKQRDAVDSHEPDASVDAVMTYALHHELPPEANRELFKEMFRIMKPGADIVMADPPPFRAVDPFHAAVLDWDTKHRNEPFFSAACLANWDDMMREVGFVNVESYALGKDGYPWITRAAKPAETLSAS
jgi:SAM-dependent methyltransferase